MNEPLRGARIALLVEEGFEDRELTGPADALRAAGATVVLVGPSAGASFREGLPLRGHRGDTANSTRRSNVMFSAKAPPESPAADGGADAHTWR